ncbi:isochorismatase family protein [Pseudonocardia sp. H11422]|uniref:isochorismatase family protein n=1 Tax=Pseudonocardia sp. H11422 TaxID=2835866 RepID=UPI0027E255EE|nr:isochorismatase family protein [Pseudonocardia sp. H11422]
MDTQTDEIYDRAGFGRTVRRGVRPAVLVVDFSYGFTDPQYPTGADMSTAVLATRRLLDAARAVGAPALYTTIAFDGGQRAALPWLQKAPGLAALQPGTRLVEIDDRVAPEGDDTVLVKTGASAFFGTPLPGILAGLGVDTLIVTGATTSGCVRASVVDAVQYGYPVLVPRECVADRAQGPHDANLFDIAAKYADVVGLDDVLDHLGSLPDATAHPTTDPAEVPA